LAGFLKDFFPAAVNFHLAYSFSVQVSLLYIMVRNLQKKYTTYFTYNCLGVTTSLAFEGENKDGTKKCTLREIV
jgi:hypothetical protein